LIIEPWIEIKILSRKAPKATIQHGKMNLETPDPQSFKQKNEKPGNLMTNHRSEK
jgi:hypothetical protein